MKPSGPQTRILTRMASGARLRWNSATGNFQLTDGTSTRTIQARTVIALDVAGLIERDVLGDCALSARGTQLATSMSSKLA